MWPWVAGSTLQVVDPLDVQALVNLLVTPFQVGVGEGGLVDALTLSKTTAVEHLSRNMQQ